MPKNLESKSIEQLMAEAEELIRQIRSDAIGDMEEDHRLQFEKHAQRLDKIKSEALDTIDRKGTPETDSGAEGMHEAILDIVNAFRELKKYLS